jgi:chromosome segregation ATPase
MAEVVKPKMTAAQIRSAMSPMAQFVPAIMAAIDIIEAAEAAEKYLADATKIDETRKKSLTNEIAALEAAKSSISVAHATARHDFKAFSDEVAAKKTAMNAELKAAQEDHAKVMDELEAKRAAKQKEIDDIEKAKAAQQSVFDKLKHDFDSWKQERKLA